MHASFKRNKGFPKQNSSFGFLIKVSKLPECPYGTVLLKFRTTLWLLKTIIAIDKKMLMRLKI